jgi:predicted nuclease of restriction endonuclease-like RecB superfamily
MLTKDLLKFTKRSGKVHPKYLNTKDPVILDVAKKLSDVYASASDQTMTELESQLDALYDQPAPYYAGFCKLLSDRCQFYEDEGDCLQQRWRWFKLSRELRHDMASADASRSDFQQHFSLAAEKPLETIKHELYSDLPLFRRLKSFESISPNELVDRYNCAQIQGLLIHAQSMKVTISGRPSIEQKRALVQKLKFHRLLAQIDVDGDQMKLDISGPLSLIDARQTYGMRLSNFFPYILLFDKWTLVAELRMNRQNLILELDHKKAITSHYKGLTGYIPAEFQNFLSAFNAKATATDDWRALQASDFIQLAGKSYLFPDIKISKSGNAMVYMEIFHRWHQAQLGERLDALAKTPGLRILLAICKSLKLKEEYKQKLRDLEQVGIRSIYFREFPTPKAVLTQLSRFDG